jgi:hypothetical protein
MKVDKFQTGPVNRSLSYLKLLVDGIYESLVGSRGAEMKHFPSYMVVAHGMLK